MQKNDIKFTYLGMDSSNALEEYAKEKIAKREDLLEKTLSIEIAFRQNKSSKGVKDNFRVDISVDLPETPIRVEERGEEMYANIDKAVDTLFRRLTRYDDMKEHWSGAKAWSVDSTGLEDIEDGDDEKYTNYVPKIVRRKKVEDMSPMEEGEAIEKMEMLGYDSFLFRSKSTDKISLVYRRKDGTYGLVEPS